MALLHGSKKSIKLCEGGLKVILCIHLKFKIGDEAMACKTKTPKKTHLKRSKYRVRNWPEYNKGLKQRGRILIWVDPRCDWLYQGVRKPGGKIIYSDLAIEMFLRVRQLFHIPLRQSEGFITDIMTMLNLDLPVPNYTVVSRRSMTLEFELKRYSKKDKSKFEGPTYMIIDSTGLKVYGEGEWANVKHGTKIRRDWRKLHVSVNEKGDIQAVELTDRQTDDASQVDNLHKKSGEKVDVAIADGAYDTTDVYSTFIAANKDAVIIIPPRKSAVLSDDSVLFQRNKHIEFIQNNGRDEWEKRSGYTMQSRSENTMFRYKTTFGDKLHARLFESQKNEAILSCSILNKMASLGMPKSYKVA